MRPLTIFFIVLITIFVLFSCRENPAKNDDGSSIVNDSLMRNDEDTLSNADKTNYTQKGTTEGVGEVRTNKGIGPIDRVDLAPQIDEEMAREGKELYNDHCASCHRIHESSMGPALGSVLDRRSPEFVMNMILNTDEMIEKEPIIRSLHAEYESEMVQVNVSKEEARAIVEYLRNY